MTTYSIPVKINILIIAVCSVLYFILLYAVSHTTLIGLKLLLGLAFGIIMIPVYSLMHEAAHNALHPTYRWNVFLGRCLCCLFIVPFTFFRHCHLKHHKKNRTDEEMWDLYYEHQNKWLRYGNLYLMMIGFGYLALWLSVILFAIAPRLINSGIFKKHNEIKGFLEGSDDVHKLKVAQFEAISVILFQVLCLWILKWDFTSWLILYLIHGFIWSSQNYVNHAFSPRDIINGAHNLKVPVWLKLIYLNFNLHLAHHQNPKIPWLHLPKFIKSGKGRFSFFKNYVRLWKGPKLTKEDAPKTFTN
ncbi:MAG: fatty acid desaturase [Ginsengibacter sp.]